MRSSCSDNELSIDENAISTTLGYSTFETFGDALADQITAGDGAVIENTFRNSVAVIDSAKKFASLFRLSP